MRKKKILGIDVGSHAVKLVQIHATKKGQVTLEKSACFPWERKNGKTKASSQELKAFLQTCAITKTTVTSAIDDPSLIIRRMSFPEMPSRDLQEALKWKVKKELGEDPEDVIVDYLPVGESTQQGKKLIDLMVFAIRKQILETHVELLQAAGLKPVCVEPPSTGLLHLFQTCPALSSEELFVALDLGASHTELILAQGGKPLFIRIIPFSGQQMTRGLQEAFDLEEGPAEKWKKQIGFEAGKSETRDLERVPEVLLPFLDEFLMEIRYSLGYIQDQLVHAPPTKKFFLFGGGAELPGLAARLEKEFDIPCTTLPQFADLGLTLSPEYKSFGQPLSPSNLATALGLALREARP